MSQDQAGSISKLRAEIKAILGRDPVSYVSNPSDTAGGDRYALQDGTVETAKRVWATLQSLLETAQAGERPLWFTESDAPKLSRVTRQNGVAGQFQLTVHVTYEGQPSEVHKFVGSTYGGPIVAISPSGTHVFVSSAVTDRIGTELTPEWVRRFYEPHSV